MVKIIKKAKSKWFLLFLLGLMSVEVQGQVDGKFSINFAKVPQPETEHTDYGVRPKYDLIVNSLKTTGSVFPPPIKITANINMAIPNGNGTTDISYDYTVEDSGGYQYPDTFIQSILDSMMSFYGVDWGWTDTGSIEVTMGGTGTAPPPCANTCPLGYFLTPYCSCILEPCNTVLKTKINTFANNAIVKTQILALQASAKTDAFEKSTRIDKDPMTSALTSPGLGAPGTANSVGMTANATTQSLLHSHPDNSGSSTYPTHSPGDIYGLNTAYKAFNNVLYSITVGITHAYMLVVENPEQLASFILFNPQAKTLIPGTGGFIPGTTLDTDFEKAKMVLENQGESVDSAYASAFAYLLKLHKSGLVLYESSITADGSTNFHSKNTSSTVIPAQAITPTTPAKPETTTYTKNDCQ